jgi:hypothetical protein
MKYVCPVKGCNNMLHSPMEPFCAVHWGRLSKETRASIKEGQKQTLREERAAIDRAIKEIQ